MTEPDPNKSLPFQNETKGPDKHPARRTHIAIRNAVEKYCPVI
jgi:hypothetical protein